MIEFRAVTGGYGGAPVLKDVSLRFPEGLIHTLVGPNGCGKSTLLRFAARLLTPASGSVTLDGRDLREYGRTELARRVSLLPQSRNIPNITVASLALHGRYPYLSYPRQYGKKDREAAEAALAAAGAAEFRRQNVQTLSGGQRQKAYLAMLIAQDTPTVLLDEPTTYLDIGHQLVIMELVREFKRRGKTVILVLHDLNLAFQYSDRIVLLRDGRAEACGPPREICREGLLDGVFGVRTGIVETRHGGAQLLFAPNTGKEESI